MIITMLAMTASMAFAQEKVGILLEAPIEFCNDENVHELIDGKTSALFSKDRFYVMSTKDSVAATDAYRKTNNMADMINEGRGGYTKPMRMDNVIGLGKQMGADYVLFFKLSNDAPKMGGNLSDLAGEPNTRETANRGVALIMDAITYDNYINPNEISVRAVPVSATSILFYIELEDITGTEIEYPLMFDLEHGLLTEYELPKPVVEPDTEEPEEIPEEEDTIKEE